MSTDEEPDKPEAGEGGEGKEVYPYGEYEGARDDQLDRHGVGSALLPNGDIYEGFYLHGKRHDVGTYCFKNGARYSGEWRKGMKHGQGTFHYPDGSMYQGNWRKDNKHGLGSYHYTNGDVYEGYWFKNFRSGYGFYRYKESNCSYYGQWENGIMKGYGTLTYPAPYMFYGTFERNLPKGKGFFTFEGKWILHGFYVNIRDPAFDYVGAKEMELKPSPIEGEEPEGEINRESPKGIVPIWRSRFTTHYKNELIPPMPVDLPRKESVDSMIDIIDYLQKQYGKDMALTMEEEMDDHKPTPSPVPMDLIIADSEMPMEAPQYPENFTSDEPPTEVETDAPQD